MADIKISELGAASAVNATDLFPMTSNGVTVKATAQQIKNYMGVGNLTDLDTTDKSSTVAAINEVNTKVSKTEVLIAYVQTSLVASKAYAVGDPFIYNGLLYVATAAIAQGGTIVIGSSGNAVLADCVVKQIGDINNKVTNLIKYNTISGATGAFGEIVIGSSSTIDAIISAYTDYAGGNCMCIPYYASGNFAVKVVQMTDYTPVANTNVGVYVRYIPAGAI